MKTTEDCGCTIEHFESLGREGGYHAAVRTLCPGCQLDRLYPEAWKPEAPPSLPVTP